MAILKQNIDWEKPHATGEFHAKQSVGMFKKQAFDPIGLRIGFFERLRFSRIQKLEDDPVPIQVLAL